MISYSTLGKDNLFSQENFIRVRLNEVDYSALSVSPETLYSCLCDLLLCPENLFYYCSQKSSCRTLRETRKFVKKLISKKILVDELDKILISMGWDKNNIDINNTTLHGDLAEYLMSLIIEKFNISKTLISKVSLKTSPKMSAYGNDNIYYDIENNVLYYGESKFHENTRSSIVDAYDSITDHLSGVTEFAYVSNHTTSFIAEDGRSLKKIEKKFNLCKLSDVSLKTITFIMSQDKYEIREYEKVIMSLRFHGSVSNDYLNESIFVFLPIISKTDFLVYFEKEVSKI